jgi:ABC-2 type transport system ATP-binding protein
MSHTIETVGLTRRFGRRDAVDALSLRVPVGSVFALIGPNGAGKTTTIKLLMNLIRPTCGHAHVLGVDSRRLGSRQFERIGYVSENQRLPGWMTTEGLLEYVRPFYPTWDDQLCARLCRELTVDLTVPLGALSRGMRMKAALLSSLAYRPELLVLDEPFSGLDPMVRDELVQALADMPREHPWTVFVSSHDIEEVERLANVVGFIDGGRLVAVEPVRSLRDRFRLVEVLMPEGAEPATACRPEWWIQGTAGRTLRFIDSDHAAPDAHGRITAAYPGADIRVSELSLREIFVALGRRPATASQTGSS